MFLYDFVNNKDLTPFLPFSPSLALNISADELLGIKPIKSGKDKPNKKILRKVQQIEKLPPAHQKTLLKTIDAFMKGVQK